MRIAFVGDMHGRAFHALAAVLELQERTGTAFDLVVQVGDFGYPVPERADVFSARYLEADPAEGDLARLITAGGPRAGVLQRLRRLLAGPVHFVRGNHEDVKWLAGLPRHALPGTAPADPFDLFHYVPDGRILEVGGARIAFLGGVEELPGEAAIDREAYDALMDEAPGSIDLLVTHEGPYGSSRGHRGNVLGSRLITELVERVQPAYHVFGHAHQRLGPERAGKTAWLGVDALVASALWQPDARGLKPGSLAVLDTDAGNLRHVTDAWLGAFPTPFDFDAWATARAE